MAPRDLPTPHPGAHGLTPGTITTIVVNRQGGDGLVACLTSLRQGGLTPDDILVVDNASTDGSDQAAEELGVRVLRTGANLGYAGGANVGLAEVTTPYVVVMNMDLLVDPGWLVPLIDTLRDDPTVGAVCPLILLAGTERVNAAGQSVTMSGLGFNRFLDAPAAQVPPEPHEVSGIHGAAVAMRTDVLRELGGWDDSGFLYHEDVELSWLLRLTGRRLVCDPRSRVWHDYELSMSPRKLELLERNRKAMLRTHLHPRTRYLLAPVLFADDAVVVGLRPAAGPRLPGGQVAGGSMGARPQPGAGRPPRRDRPDAQGRRPGRPAPHAPGLPAAPAGDPGWRADPSARSPVERLVQQVERVVGVVHEPDAMVVRRHGQPEEGPGARR